MKAAVFYGIKDIRTEEVEKPKIQDNEILINVKACGICGSDLHMYKLNLYSPMLTRPLKKGGIPGHEYSGEIVEVGKNIKKFKVGDRVVALSNGGMAEYVPIPITYGYNVYKLPSSVGYEAAATLEPLANSYHALMKGKPFNGANIVIYGAGTIGLGIIQCLKALGIKPNKLVIIDLSDSRLKLAKELGANEIINAKTESVPSKIMEIVGSMPTFGPAIFPMPKVDIVYDCVGYIKDQKAPLVLQQAINMARSYTGTVVVHGIFEESVKLDLTFMIAKQVKVIGSFGFTPLEMKKSIKLIENKQVDRSKILSHEFSVDQAKEAFETQCNIEESVKVLIKP
ncbi:MAG: zinc-binding dehydrogenase [Candidatus Lokiarchaeota archaeon]|nr:zinc-binding dehydrogenase [Candidatus Lokiarchaeota archaeon]